jgi:hypothetical protein
MIREGDEERELLWLMDHILSLIFYSSTNMPRNPNFNKAEIESFHYHLDEFID